MCHELAERPDDLRTRAIERGLEVLQLERAELDEIEAIAEHVEHRECEAAELEIALGLPNDRELAHQSTPLETMPYPGATVAAPTVGTSASTAGPLARAISPRPRMKAGPRAYIAPSA